VSTERDRDDRSSEAQSTGESETLADPAAADAPLAGVAAGPTADPAGGWAPEPTPVIPVAQSSFRQPPGTALPSDQPADAGGLTSRPEVLAGAAFAGGLAVAMLIRRALN